MHINIVKRRVKIRLTFLKTENFFGIFQNNCGIFFTDFDWFLVIVRKHFVGEGCIWNEQ